MNTLLTVVAPPTPSPQAQYVWLIVYGILLACVLSWFWILRAVRRLIALRDLRRSQKRAAQAAREFDAGEGGVS